MKDERGFMVHGLYASMIAMIVFGKLVASVVFTPGGITGWKLVEAAVAFTLLYFLVKMARQDDASRKMVLLWAFIFLPPIFLLAGGRQMVEARCRAELGSLRAALSSYHEREKHYPQELSELTREGKDLKRIPNALTYSYHAGSEAKVTNGVSADDAGGWMFDNIAGDEHYGAVWINCTHTDRNGKNWNSY